jgi:hypothetical protein
MKNVLVQTFPTLARTKISWCLGKICDSLSNPGLVFVALALSTIQFHCFAADDTVVAYKSGVNDCVPISVLNSMRYGSPSFQRVFDEILGNTFEQKLTYSINKWGKLPSSVKPNKPLFADGIEAKDVAVFCNHILKEFGHDLTVVEKDPYRRINESKKEHLIRIHGWFKQSIENGFPPVVSMCSLFPILDQSGNMTEWKSCLAHGVSITSVPNSIFENLPGFGFEYIATENGSTLGALMIYERERFYDPRFAKQKHELFYPGIVSENLCLGIDTLEPHLRGMVVLTNVTGLFNVGEDPAPRQSEERAAPASTRFERQ